MVHNKSCRKIAELAYYLYYRSYIEDHRNIVDISLHTAEDTATDGSEQADITLKYFQIGGR